ncbi:hypothetical protein A2U01_0024069, partial [Trifolium medium]|nr:hypothetical protein [Trifolium medium]
GSGRWEWLWRRRLFVWEEILFEELRERLPRVDLVIGEDEWHWGLEEGGFTVKSAYLLLGRSSSPGRVFSASELRVFQNIWKSPAPSKVVAFSWKLLRNSIPTKLNLAARGIQVDGGSTTCVHCLLMEESSLHLFLFCDFAYLVWNSIFRWLGLTIVTPSNLFLLFECLSAAAGNNKIRNGFWSIWHATLWVIWRSRNDVSFANGVKDLEKAVDDIKLLSWRWSLSRRKIPICLFYEWCWDPGSCLRR